MTPAERTRRCRAKKRALELLDATLPRGAVVEARAARELTYVPLVATADPLPELRCPHCGALLTIELHAGGRQ